MTFADNIRLSKNFTTNEFRCKCCGAIIIEVGLIGGLQQLRDLIGKPIIINSGYRCEKHNKEVGGSPKSQHLLGKAADIRTLDMSPVDLAYYAKEIDVFKNGGIGLYPNFVHLDVRGYPARWKY